LKALAGQGGRRWQCSAFALAWTLTLSPSRHAPYRQLHSRVPPCGPLFLLLACAVHRSLGSPTHPARALVLGAALGASLGIPFGLLQDQLVAALPEEHRLQRQRRQQQTEAVIQGAGGQGLDCGAAGRQAAWHALRRGRHTVGLVGGWGALRATAAVWEGGAVSHMQALASCAQPSSGRCRGRNGAQRKPCRSIPPRCPSTPVPLQRRPRG
jgi:hypothetical protein